MAITAWSAKVRKSATWCGAKGPGSRRRDADHADRGPLAHQRAEQQAAIASRARQIANVQHVAIELLGVLDVHQLTGPDGLGRQEGGERYRERAFQGLVTLGRGGGERHQLQGIVRNARHHGRVAAQQQVGIVGDGIEHRLHVGGRAGDHFEDIGRRGLSLQRLLGLVEQPHVLDRDHGLVGEGAE